MLFAREEIIFTNDDGGDDGGSISRINKTPYNLDWYAVGIFFSFRFVSLLLLL